MGDLKFSDFSPIRLYWFSLKWSLAALPKSVPSDPLSALGGCFLKTGS
jgi:hypothetical protein